MPLKTTEPGFVYLLRMGRFIKIGSSKNPKKRARSFASLPYLCVLIHQIASLNAGQIEHALHRRFFDEQVKREWFRLSKEQIARLCQIERIDCLGDIPPDLACSAPRGKQRSITLPSHLYDDLRLLAARNNRSILMELKLAFESHMRKTNSLSHPLQE